MPSREQRVRVWRGELKKTTGGLTKDDLVKNRKGKIVSRRKSRQAADQNNLGEWLRNKGDRFEDTPAARAAKGLPKPKHVKPKPQAPEPKPVRPPPKLPKKKKEAKPAPPKPKPRPKDTEEALWVMPKRPRAREKLARRLKKAGVPTKPKASYGHLKNKSEITVQNIPERRESRTQKKERIKRETAEYKQRAEARRKARYNL